MTQYVKDGDDNKMPRMPQYVKVEGGHKLFYIQSQMFAAADFTHFARGDHHQLMLIADYAVDTRENKILKCRVSLDIILDKFVGA